MATTAISVIRFGILCVLSVIISNVLNANGLLLLILKLRFVLQEENLNLLILIWMS